MRYFVVFALVILAACNIRAKFTKDEVIAIFTDCKDETGAPDADFEAMRKHLPVESKEGKCMVACIGKKFGVMNDEGKIVKDVAIEVIKHKIKDDDKKQLAVGIYESCGGLEFSDDHCEAAAKFDSCIKLKMVSEGILPTEN